jgi:nucleotide-binding universal stress UspA family protein
MYKRILVPVDGSGASNKALAAALQLAGEVGARVRLLHSLDELAYLPGADYRGNVLQLARDNATRVLAEALDQARAAGVEADTRLVEVPGRRLGEEVEDEVQAWKADLVVLGTHGRRGLSRLLLGSGAEQVIRLASVPVLTIRSEEVEA